ncbi:hypothetical protein E2C01_001319 [Portunus trituberculatus]|uniref:Uncharacterized protein n=1 Tax=Portunus trituberculatus TaxID=210409 RepID=A0A5B7CHI5_PORTR|nr:hypothetical protein [Portunus trituberculatus]
MFTNPHQRLTDRVSIFPVCVLSPEGEARNDRGAASARGTHIEGLLSDCHPRLFRVCGDACLYCSGAGSSGGKPVHPALPCPTLPLSSNEVSRAARNV